MKVVCVYDSLPSAALDFFRFPNGPIKKGDTYTVLEAFTTRLGGQSAYRLQEKPVVPLHPQSEDGWNTWAFVPLHYYQAEFCVKEENKEPVTG